MDLEIQAIPAFTDNYIWAVVSDGKCMLVDPGDAAAPLAFLAEHDLVLVAVLLTHHHADHTGGVERVLASHQAPVWGPEDPRMPSATRFAHENEHIKIEALGLDFQVIATPGHTSSHIAFYGNNGLFCGDTLFSAGCGRLFEGTPAEMQQTLDKLAALPDSTRVFCGHEYTAANCDFALRIEPDNPDLARRCDEVTQLRRTDRMTLPSTIGAEKSFNPFLRTREPAVVAAAQRLEPGTKTAPDAVFGVIRRCKDAA
ncbi:MAG: hydroxyacylglutathione hydrolase [Xanthomonadaceae bacterium]|nr:hydroxyacylglutathione hydrolase [Xanthomonadaceae bacterium]